MTSKIALIALPLALLAGCAVPEASTDKVYQEQEAVTGSRIARKTPQNVESVDGETVRQRGGVATTAGVPRGKDH
jgi:hypothetical protein